VVLDKWKACGFTPVPGKVVRVPLIAECPVNFECTIHDENACPFACQQHRRGGLFGGALRAADAFGRLQIGQLDADAELGIMVRPTACDLTIRWRRQPASLRPFLQRSLGVARRAGARTQTLAPEPLHQGGRHRIAAIQEHGTDQRLAHVGEDRGAAAATGVGLRTAELDRFTEID
jgi:hypothetical protein